jgi:hypothetical protein
LDALLVRNLGTVSVGESGPFEFDELALLAHVVEDAAKGATVTPDNIAKLVGLPDVAAHVVAKALASELVADQDGRLVATERGVETIKAIRETPPLSQLVDRVRANWKGA